MAPRLGNPNTRTGSTTFVYEPARVAAVPPGAGKRAKRLQRWGHLSRRSPREALTLRITYKGGHEGWWLVEARGSSGVFPAVACIHDVMREVLHDHTTL